jgi:hypothetical protein
MKTIELALESVTGYLVSIKRNPMNGWYEIEIGLPNTWVFDENNEIKCDVLSKSDAGKLIKISPKNDTVVIDDLITFVEVIIETNEKIAEKEKEFTDKMEQMKGMLETEAKKFYEELDELRSNSFKQRNDNFVKTLHPEGEKKQRKPRTPKEKTEITSSEPVDTTTTLLEIEDKSKE